MRGRTSLTMQWCVARNASGSQRAGSRSHSSSVGGPSGLSFVQPARARAARSPTTATPRSMMPFAGWGPYLSFLTFRTRCSGLSDNQLEGDADVRAPAAVGVVHDLEGDRPL